MKYKRSIKLGFCIGMCVITWGCSSGESPTERLTDLEDPTGFFTQNELVQIEQLSPADPSAPADPTNRVAGDPAAAKLGRFLFFDTRLSADGEQACATCHLPEHGFADPEPLSSAVGTTKRHSPSLLNAAFYHWYFWDGRADTLWAQATKPLEDPNEQGTTRLDVAHLIARDAELRAAYEAIFEPLPNLTEPSRFPESGRPVPDQPDHPHHQAWSSMTSADQHQINLIFANVAKAIAAYETQLLSFGSAFDTYVDGLRTGDPVALGALTEGQRRGLKLFLGKGNCIDCHSGPALSDTEFHNLGMAAASWSDDGDLGRYAGIEVVQRDTFNAMGPYSDAPEDDASQEIEFIAQLDENRGAFKTPTLRNVARTAPYMHDGQFETLEAVVRFYSELDHQPSVGTRDASLERLDLTDQEVADLVSFLEALDGEPIDSSLTRAPDSPTFEPRSSGLEEANR